MNSSDPYRTPAASALEPAGLRSGLTGYLDGTQPLWKAFWLVYLLGSVLVFGLLGIGISSVLVRGVLLLKHSLGLAQETAIVLLLAPPIIGFLAFSLLAVRGQYQVAVVDVAGPTVRDPAWALGGEQVAVDPALAASAHEYHPVGWKTRAVIVHRSHW